MVRSTNVIAEKMVIEMMTVAVQEVFLLSLVTTALLPGDTITTELGFTNCFVVNGFS